ncbi:hypothetical protein ACFWPA_16580 [Rhodococcus sp. NPDC058505]|uniref:hypothetical protein n=1 Tax=unclassified Rhodococcus (in: high G+C Gram-positive bacteria) TaxID=192944 RepID=UPI00364D9E26
MADGTAIAEDFFTHRDGASRTYSPTRRRKTRRHRQLLERYDQTTGSWSSRALHACLHTLTFNTSSEAWCVGVLDAWTDGDSAFCVVYRYRDDPRTLGTRRLVDDHGDPYGPGPDDPEQFGHTVATNDIGEPLGTVARSLQRDAARIHWWGSLGDFLPSPPADHDGPVQPANPPTRTRRVRDMTMRDIESAIGDSIEYYNDWVSIADVLAPLGTTSWVADRSEIRRVLECIDISERFRLGKVRDGFVEIPKSLPVPALLDHIFGHEKPADRSFAMMELFIATT